MKQKNVFCLGFTLLLLGVLPSWADTEAIVEKEQVEKSSMLFKGLDFAQKGELYWNFAGGNSDYSSWAVEHNGSLRYFRHTLENKLKYKSYTQTKVKSQEVTELSAKYIFSFLKNLGGFYGYSMTLNHFETLRKAQNHDVGPRLFFSLSDKTYLLSELAYRYNLEQDRKLHTNTSNKLRAYAEIGSFLPNGLELKFWVEYVQRLSRPRDYIVSFEPSIAVYFMGFNYVRISTMGYYHEPLTFEGEKFFSYYGETSIGTKF